MNTALYFPIPEISIDNWDFNVIGDNRFKDDVWDLTQFFHNKKLRAYSSMSLNYKRVSDIPDIVEPIKRYCYIRLGQVKPQTIVQEYYEFSGKIINFLKINNLSSLEQIDTYYFMQFNIWLKQNYLKSEKSIPHLARIAHTLLQIISMGQALNFPNISADAIVLETSVWDWWGNNKLGREIRLLGPDDRSIPIPLWRDILQKAWEEQNIIEYIKGRNKTSFFSINYAKFGILIQAYTGLRISEVLCLKVGCVEKDNKDRYWLTAEIEKTENTATSHKILIPESIYNLVLDMHTITEPLRQGAGTNNYLFYVPTWKRKKETPTSEYKSFQPTLLDRTKWFNLFLVRNNLPTTFTNSQNKIIRISSHCFRHTFARIAVAEKNVNPSVIQTHFKHLSIEMTMHYVNLTKNDLKKSYIQGMIESDKIYTQGKEGEQFKKRLSEVKTVSDLNEAVDGISKLFGINPLPFGLCLYDFKRGPCPHLGVQSCYMANCSDFVTNETFLPNFENEINILNQHIHQCQKNGQIVEEKKAKFHLHKLSKIVEKIE